MLKLPLNLPVNVLCDLSGRRYRHSTSEGMIYVKGELAGYDHPNTTHVAAWENWRDEGGGGKKKIKK